MMELKQMMRINQMRWVVACAAVLLGSALMQAEDPGAKLAELMTV